MWKLKHDKCSLGQYITYVYAALGQYIAYVYAATKLSSELREMRRFSQSDGILSFFIFHTPQRYARRVAAACGFARCRKAAPRANRAGAGALANHPCGASGFARSGSAGFHTRRQARERQRGTIWGAVCHTAQLAAVHFFSSSHRTRGAALNHRERRGRLRCGALLLRPASFLRGPRIFQLGKPPPGVLLRLHSLPIAPLLRRPRRLAYQHVGLIQLCLRVLVRFTQASDSFLCRHTQSVRRSTVSVAHKKGRVGCLCVSVRDGLPQVDSSFSPSRRVSGDLLKREPGGRNQGSMPEPGGLLPLVEENEASERTSAVEGVLPRSKCTGSIASALRPPARTSLIAHCILMEAPNNSHCSGSMRLICHAHCTPASSSFAASAASGGAYPQVNEAFGRVSARPVGRGSGPFFAISSAAAWMTDNAVHAVGLTLALVSMVGLAPFRADGERGLLGGPRRRRCGLSKPRCIPELGRPGNSELVGKGCKKMTSSAAESFLKVRGLT